MTHLFFICFLLLPIINAHPMWSEENDDENNSYGDNQNGDEENDNNIDSSENESSYDGQNSDNRRHSPYNFPSHSEQSELERGFDSFRPNTYNGYANNRMYDQPYEYNNQNEWFHGSNDFDSESNNGNDFSNEITEDNTENYYRREEAYTESYFPSSQSGDDYRALKRKINTPRFKPRTVFPSTDDFNRNPYERRSDSGHSFTYGGLGKGGHNKNIFNIHNKIIYTR